MATPVYYVRVYQYPLIEDLSNATSIHFTLHLATTRYYFWRLINVAAEARTANFVCFCVQLHRAAVYRDFACVVNKQ